MSETTKPSNLRIWERLGKTDPRHTKSFQRAGGFKGTAIKPMWSFRSMTEYFGPAGIGWGPEMPLFETREAADEQMVFCTVGVWYLDPETQVRGLVYGVGGDKYLLKQKDGLRSSDEAFKAAYTDAIGNAVKLIGVAADVHMGLFDDNKYVRETLAEFERESVETEVEVQQAVPESLPQELEFQYSSNLLICRPVDVQARKDKKGKEFYALKLNGKIGKNTLVFCWHGSMFPALAEAKGKICKFAVDTVGDFCNISEVLEVGGVRFDGATPEERSIELKARTGASLLDLSEKDLLDLYKLCGNDWQKTLDAINNRLDEIEAAKEKKFQATDDDLPF